ncbi:MAG: hypothetical protein C0518_06680 [Opitutus sp.]|nr:hypothetical protein [Opitutus sp.]
MTASLPIFAPRRQARLAGALYLATLLLGIFAQAFVSGRLVATGNAGLTAANILQHETLYRAGFAAYLVEMACQLAMILLFYPLLRPVDRTVSQLTLVFGLAGCVVKLVGRVFFYAPLLVLGGAKYLDVFADEQLRALALLFLRLNYVAETVAVVFFGLYALAQGYLVFRSTFLPRILGVLGAVAGLGWLTYLYEPLATRLLPFIMASALLGSVSLIFWLLAFGVDERRWRAQAAAQPPPP